jgi:hypothetical protein
LTELDQLALTCSADHSLAPTAGTRALSVGFSYDLFRSSALDQWDAAPQARWLQEFIAPALEFAGASIRPAFDKETITGITSWLAEQFAEDNLSPGTSGWCDLYSAVCQRERLISIFQPMLDFDLVVGYELPPNQIRFLSENDKPFIDIRIDALRFFDGALFSVRTNHPGLAVALSQFHASDDEFLAASGFLRAELARNRDDGVCNTTDLIFVGQVDVDTSLIANGRITRIGQFLPNLVSLMRSHDRMVLQPHPLARENADITELLSAFPQAILGRGSVYAAVCHRATRTVVTLSSSVATEARLLGKHSICLLNPDVSQDALGPKLCRGTFRIDQVLGSGSFWEAITKVIQGQFGQGLIPRRRMPRLSEKALRSALGIYQAAPLKPEPNCLISIGEIVPLIAPAAVAVHCLFGWSHAEPLGVWTLGPVSALSFDAEHTPSAVELSVCAFIGTTGRELNLEICISGADGATWPLLTHLFSNEAQRTLIVPLPPAPQRRRYDLRFRIMAPASPLSLGLSEDTRELGIRLSWFRLIPT